MVKIKIKFFLVSIILVFGLIGSVRMLEPFGNEDYLLHVNVENDKNEKLRDLKVKIYIYELGVFMQSSDFDLQDRDKAGKSIFWEVPSFVKGDYWVRITVSNDDFREVRHRLITV